MDAHQFSVERNGAGEWVILPNCAATNETLLNGKTVSVLTVLHEGDVLSVGREQRDTKAAADSTVYTGGMMTDALPGFQGLNNRCQI